MASEAARRRVEGRMAEIREYREQHQGCSLQYAQKVVTKRHMIAQLDEGDVAGVLRWVIEEMF